MVSCNIGSYPIKRQSERHIIINYHVHGLLFPNERQKYIQRNCQATLNRCKEKLLEFCFQIKRIENVLFFH